MRKWLVALLIMVGAVLGLLALPICADAQVVAQGPPATTSNARAWPFKVVFGDVQVDPRDITDRSGRVLGKITFDGYQESAANSSTTILLAGQTFTGTYESTLSYGGVRVIVGSAPETGTLYLDWSTDGTSLDSEDSYPTVANIGTVIQSAVKAKFFRVKYTENGAQNQSYFHLQSAYMTFQTPDLFNTLLAPSGAQGSVAPWTSRSLVTGGMNLSGGAGAGVTPQRFIYFPWTDAGMSDGTYNVQYIRALPGEGDGYATRLLGTGSPVTGYFPMGGAVADAQAALAQSTGGEVRITPYRAFHVNFRDALGNELVSATTTPGASDRGLVVRNIPSGTQEVQSTLGTPLTATWTSATANNTTLTLALNGNYQSAVFSMTITSGTFNLSGFVNFEGSVDGATYLALAGIDLTSGTSQGATIFIPTSVNRMYLVDVSGLKGFRLRLNPVLVNGTGTPQINVTLQASTMAASNMRTVSVSSASGFFPTTAAGPPASQRLSDGAAFYNALSDTQLRATPVPVSGTVTTGGLTDTQLRATPVPVSGGLTDTQIRATALPVSVATLPSHDVTNAGTFAVQATLAAETTKVIGTVNVAAGQSIQANAGTNLNTSALALEAGHLATIDTKIPNQGQALAAASVPVVLTAIQQTALTPPAAIVGFNLEATQLSVKADVDKIPSQGQALAAASMPVVLTAIQQAALTPPAAITGFALETGGNLAALLADTVDIEVNTAQLDIALSTLRDALTGASPNNKTLQDLYTLIASTITAPGATSAATSVVQVSSTRTLPLPPCNPVRRTYCSPKGF